MPSCIENRIRGGIYLETFLNTVSCWKDYLMHSSIIVWTILLIDIVVLGYVLYSIFENAGKNNLFEEYASDGSENKQRIKRKWINFGIVLVVFINVMFILVRLF